MNTAKKLSRRAQRQVIGKLHREKMTKIMECKGDDKTFYKLIREQRSNTNTTTEFLTIEGRTVDNEQEILNTWADYFEELAQPLKDNHFNEDYRKKVESELKLMEDILKFRNQSPTPASMKELKDAISILNSNKAPDVYGLTAEHLKKGDIINTILKDRQIPSCLRFGILTPIFKKGKPVNPSNYRGISITPVILEVLEKILSSRHEQILIETQSELQYGFTKGKFSLMSAFLLTECQLETKSNKETMFLTTLDTQKAFDVVSHDIFLHRLYYDDINDADRLIIKDVYTDMSTKIKWNGELSRKFPILQGVRQGGILSAGHYKRYNNPLLLQLESNFTGVIIGTEKVQHITCADDLALIST